MMDIRLVVVSAVSFIVLYLVIFWLILFLERREEIRKDPKPKKFPDITVVVPAYNEENTIGKCIESLLKLKYPRKINIIVVNDGSTDDTRKIAEKYAEKGVITLLNKENGGKANALNYALKRVKTELFTCLDADSFVSEDALMHMVGYLKDPEVAAVTPAMKVGDPRTLVQKLQYLEYMISILMRKLSAWLDIILVTPGPFTVYRTKVLKDIGGYDENTLTEDMEIAYRLHDNGYSIENSINADVKTVSPKSISGLFKQRMRWTRGSYQSLYKYSHMLLNKQYGTFGVFLLPVSILVIVLSPIAVVYSLYLLLDASYAFLKNMYYAYMYGVHLKIDVISFLMSVNAYYVFIGLLVLSLTLLILYLSHRYSKEALSMQMKFAYVVYILFYFIFLNMMWIFSFIEHMMGVARKW
jgi:cellulose synthase/poly-beta-1,6-N-acetylglucosamine synthase-like glycosyltransferase